MNSIVRSSRVLSSAKRVRSVISPFICNTCKRWLSKSSFASFTSLPSPHIPFVRSLATETERKLYKDPSSLTLIINPKKDDRDNIMQLEISSNASKQLLHIAERDNTPHIMLRVTVESGGCHGFQYLLDLTDNVDQEDVIFERDGAKIVIDPISLDYIKGSTIDFTTELIGAQFKVVGNPQAKSGCGCGTSFEIDINKL